MEQNAKNLKKVLDTLINLVKDEEDIRITKTDNTTKVDFLSNQAQAKFEYVAFVIKPKFGKLLVDSMTIVKEGIGLRFTEYMTANRIFHQKYTFTLNTDGKEITYTFDNEEVKITNPNVGFITYAFKDGKIFKTIEPMMSHFEKYPLSPIKMFDLSSFVNKAKISLGVQ